MIAPSRYRPFEPKRPPLSVQALAVIGFLTIVAGIIGVAYGFGIAGEKRSAAAAGVGGIIIAWSLGIIVGGVIEMVLAHAARAVIEMRDIALHQAGHQ